MALGRRLPIRPTSTEFTFAVMISRRLYTVPLPGRAPLAAGRAHAGHGHPQRHAGFVRRRRRALRSGRAPSTTACGWSRTAPTSSTSAASRRGPGAEPLPRDEELRRVLPVIERLAAAVRVPVSIDTYKAAVAREAVDARRRRSSTTSAACSTTRRSAAVVAATRRRARPDAQPRAVARDVRAGASTTTSPARSSRELAAAIDRGDGGRRRAARRIILDPGLGFAKRAEHTLRRRWRASTRLRGARIGRSCPGRRASRSCNARSASGRRPSATGARPPPSTASVLLGAHIVRVHDVREMVDVVRVADRIRGGQSPSASSSPTRRVGPTAACLRVPELDKLRLHVRLPRRLAPAAAGRLVGCARHRDRLDPDLRVPQAHPGHARGADGGRLAAHRLRCSTSRSWRRCRP